MPAIIRVKQLSRDFAEIRAVDDLSFTVEKGQVYGFLGQNGAGKSTTIRMLLTLVRPSSGEIEIFGMDLFKHRREILRNIGAMIERPDLYKYLSAIENLRIFATLSGVRLPDKKLMEQLDRVGLASRAHSKVKVFSQGMKQRLGIGVAMVHDPELIILDEPMNGLDPQGIADMRKLILQLSNEQGKTLFVSSHLLTEMELIADSMLIINRGKKIVEGTKEELLNPEKVQVELLCDDPGTCITQLATTKWSEGRIVGDEQFILFEMKKSEIADLNRVLVEKGIRVISLRPKHSLEDYFLSLTAR